MPISGFYEWRTNESGDKQPYYVTLKNSEPMAFAGLWERWSPGRGPIVETCSVVTTTPNELIATLHNRMPVVLDEPDYAKWLGERSVEPDELKALLKPFPADRMQVWPVSKAVGSPKNTGPELVERVAGLDDRF